MKKKIEIIIAFFLIFLLGVIFFSFFYKSFQAKPKENISTNQIPAKSDPVIVAVGDIACGVDSNSTTECRQKDVADLITRINPDHILILGDIQYDGATESQYNAYFDKAFGALKNKIYPALGNHEFDTLDAYGYFTYFGSRFGERGKGYYSLNLGSWHLTAINSNCWLSGCRTDSTQWKWLRNDLENSTAKCTLAFYHHPLISAGQHGNNTNMKDIWQLLMDNRADVVLNGHDHLYERFALIDANGNKNINGMREFVVGTGGRSHYSFTTDFSTLEARDNTSYGVLKLTLHDDSYSWEFIPTDSSGFKDSGTASCK